MLDASRAPPWRERRVRREATELHRPILSSGARRASRERSAARGPRDALALTTREPACSSRRCRSAARVRRTRRVRVVRYSTNRSGPSRFQYQALQPVRCAWPPRAEPGCRSLPHRPSPSSANATRALPTHGRATSDRQRGTPDMPSGRHAGPGLDAPGDAFTVVWPRSSRAACLQRLRRSEYAGSRSSRMPASACEYALFTTSVRR